MSKLLKRLLLSFLLMGIYTPSFCWGFYAHQRINYFAVFLLPPEMMVLYKPNISFLAEHAVDPDKRRYAVPDEGPRHYIDIDKYAHIRIRHSPGNGKMQWPNSVKIP